MQTPDSFIGSQFFTRTGGVVTCDSLLKKQDNGCKRYIFTCSTCSTDEELWPYGSISSTKSPITNGATPCGCAAKVKWTREQYVVRLKRSASFLGIEFKGFHGEWKGNQTKCIRSCPTHGEWRSSLVQDALRTKGCKKCVAESGAARDSTPEDLAVERINQRCNIDGLVFVGFDNAYAGSSSRLLIRCSAHGDFSMRYSHFLAGSTCSGCARYGFSRTDDAFIYCLMSECGAYLKVGISKDPDRRHKTLGKRTPFSFSEVISYKMMGGDARDLEASTHNKFMSAGFRGFDGATEWLRYDPCIIKHIEQRAL
jgi:hypothetical protein